MSELPTGEELAHSRVLNLDRGASGDALKVALIGLMAHLKVTEGPRKRNRRAADDQRLAAMLEAMTCDLYGNFRSEPTRYLGYSRDTSAYTIKSRYAHPLSSVTAVTSVADFLINAGYATGIRGFYDRRSNPFGGAATRRMRSRIRATEKLINLLEGHHGASVGQIGYRPDFELIRLKDANEVDYSAMHCRMCYDLAGKSLPMDNDPYTLSGLENLRDAVKFGFLVLINLSQGQRGNATDKVKVMIKGKTSFRDLLVAIERKHYPIRKWLRSGKGTQLQWLDSQVAESVMGYLVSRGIPCLPIHDSFIVPSSARKQLKSAMREAYAAHIRSPSDRPCYPSLR